MAVHSHYIKQDTLYHHHFALHQTSKSLCTDLFHYNFLNHYEQFFFLRSSSSQEILSHLQQMKGDDYFHWTPPFIPTISQMKPKSIPHLPPYFQNTDYKTILPSTHSNLAYIYLSHVRNMNCPYQPLSTEHSNGIKDTE